MVAKGFHQVMVVQKCLIFGKQTADYYEASKSMAILFLEKHVIFLPKTKVTRYY